MSLPASLLGRVLIAALVVTSTLPIGDASAQPTSAIDEARALARDGWKALDAENYKEALEKVTQAEALYHAPTHLLLMGNAQAGLGRLADALTTFEKLAAEPIPNGAPTAFKDAQETGKKRLKELISRVPSLLVVVESATNASPTVQVDGKVIDFSAGVAVRLNPGEHAISVGADGLDPVATKITLPEKGGVVRLPIVLRKKGEPATEPSGSASPSAVPSSSASAAPSGTPVTPPPERSRTPAYVAFGVAGAGLLVGAITGGLSLAMTSDLKKVCLDNVCPESAWDKLDRANSLAHASTATLVIAGVAAATGVVLLTYDINAAPSKARSGVMIAVQPYVSVGGAGFQGRF